jgi:hypothetical protein
LDCFYFCIMQHIRMPVFPNLPINTIWGQGRFSRSDSLLSPLSVFHSCESAVNGFKGLNLLTCPNDSNSTNNLKKGIKIGTRKI